jgi:signal transduction histidine kinase
MEKDRPTLRTTSSIKWAAICFLILVSFPCLAAVDTFAPKETSRKRVLVLHSYYQGYKWTDDENAGIESVLRLVVGTSSLHIEYMDSKKIYGDLYTRRLYEVYKLKYTNFKFDVIIATDDNALAFLKKYRDTLFPGAPVVFCGVNYLDTNELRKYKGFTGVNEDNDFKGCIDLVLRLHPKTRQIVFINEWTVTGQKVHNAFLKVIPYFSKSITFRLLEDEKIEDILEQLRNLPPDSIVLYTAFSRDKLGRVFEYNESIAAVALNCKAPIYTTHEFNLGLGVMGGLIVTGYDQGELAAKMALRILLGEKPDKIPVEMVSPKHYMFDYQQMRAFNVALADLPKESVIVNLPQTFYFKYKKWFDALIVIFFVLISTISVLLITLHKRKLTERELKSSREQLRTLAWRLAETEEKERKALSRELHDQVGQNLTILGVNINLLRSLVPGDPKDLLPSRITDSLAIVKQTTERIRNLMNNLRSPVLDDYGLVAAIDLYGKQCTTRTGIDIKVRGPGTDPHLPAHVENAMFRIVQEALTNVIKHAQATQVIINVIVTDARLILSIEDNGIGYNRDAATKADGQHGWGLITMTERALAVGGECRVQSSPGLGTHVIVEVPL